MMIIRPSLIGATCLLALTSAAPTLAGPDAATYRACADVLPDDRDVFLQAADKVEGGEPIDLPDQPAQARFLCMGLFGEAVLIATSGPHSFIGPGSVRDALEQSYPSVPQR
jgi:hypothetical protein